MTILYQQRVVWLNRADQIQHESFTELSKIVEEIINKRMLFSKEVQIRNPNIFQGFNGSQNGFFVQPHH